MKLSHLIIATSLTAASFATFAAPQQAPETEDKVVVSTQEQPETQGQAATDATASEAPASAPTATN